MTPAEKRIKDLIDRWLTSIELHLQYTELSDEAYWELRNWPRHDRPTRWVLELAKQKATDLQYAFSARVAMGDSKFSDSLELMAFLANLVGAQHVERFVPLAEPMADTDVPQPKPRAIAKAPETSDVPKWFAQAQTAQPKPAPPPLITPAPPAAPVARVAPMRPEVAMPQAAPMPAAAVTGAQMPARQPAPRTDPEATREMPKFRAQMATPAPPPAPPKSEPRKSQRAGTTGAAKTPAAREPVPVDEMQALVIADAIRMLNWGRTWHELAEMIARLADRPSIGEVRKILRAHRATIEKSAKAQS